MSTQVPSIAVVTGAPVTLKINGTDRTFKPLTASLIGKWCQRLAEERVAMLPSMNDLMVSLRGHDAKAISEAIKTMYDLHRQATNPTIDDLLSWMTDNPMNLVNVLAECVEGEPVDIDIFFPVILRELNDGGKFANQWLEVSGLAGNPTKPSEA